MARPDQSTQSCDDDDEVSLVLHKPSWQLRVCLVSVLITPLLYRLYLILVTIGYTLCSNETSSNLPFPSYCDCPRVDLSWTGVFPCEVGWRGSVLAVVILSAVFLVCYSVIIACLLRWNPRKKLVICSSPVLEVPDCFKTMFQESVQSTNKLMVTPFLKLSLLLLAFHLLIQSGDVELNPGPTGYEMMVAGGEKIVEALSRDPKGLALSLFTKSMISKAILDETNELNETAADKARRLYSAVLKLVQEYPERYDDFIRMFREKKPLFDDLLKEFYTSKVAVFGKDESIESMRAALSGEPTLQELSLLPVSKLWYPLGLWLTIEEELLKKIKIDSTEPDKAICMFKEFLISKQVTKCNLSATTKAVLKGFFSKEYPVQLAKFQVLMNELNVYERELADKLFHQMKQQREKLVLALVKLGLSKVAEEVCRPKEVSLTDFLEAVDPTSNPPKCVVRYASYLKGKYKKMSMIPGNWPPSCSRNRIYTSLALICNNNDEDKLSSTMEYDYIHGKIDNIVARKERIELDEVFFPIVDPETKESQLIILMNGAPGVGKTTLTRKLCIEWALGEMLQEYQLVIYIELRATNLNKERDITNLFPSESKELSEEIARYYTSSSENFGKRVLFIFDGYDEVYMANQSLLLSIIKGDRLHNCSVLVTSRPYASEYIQTLASINRQVEVLGFSSQQVKEYIESNLLESEAARKLEKILEERLDIFSLCYIPLHCRIVLFVYKKLNFKLPATLTELVEIFILHTLKHHSESDLSEQSAIFKAESIAQLPKQLSQQLQFLCTMAYSGILDGLFFFKEEQVHCKEALSLGLLTSHCSITDINMQQTFQFLHLIIQEFLAAMYLASTSREKKIKFVETFINDSKFRMTIIFLAGLTKLQFLASSESLIFMNERSQQFDSLNELTNSAETDRGSFQIKPTNNLVNSGVIIMKKELEQKLFLLLAQMVYESQTASSTSCEAIVCLNFNKLDLSRQSLSSFEALVIAYFLSSTPRDFEWNEINLTNCNLPSVFFKKKHLLNTSRYAVGMTKTLCIGPVEVECVLPILSQGLLELHLYSVTFDHNTFSMFCKSVADSSNLQRIIINDSYNFTELSRNRIIISSNIPVCSYCFKCLLNFINPEKFESMDCSNQIKLLNDCSRCHSRGIATVQCLRNLLRSSLSMNSLIFSNCKLAMNFTDSLTGALLGTNTTILKLLAVDGNKLSSLKQLSSLLAGGLSLRACGFHIHSLTIDSEKVLDITDVSSSYDDLKMLAKTLHVPECFISLKINMEVKDICYISPCYVAWLLSNNQNLQTFSLFPFNKVFYYEVTCKETLELTQVISTHKFLQSLSLPQIFITQCELSIHGHEDEDFRVKMCTNALKKLFTYLTNQVEYVSIQNLPNTFQYCEYCQVSADETVIKLCELISKSNHLRHLYLSNCLLAEDKTHSLVMAIPRSVCQVDLKGNEVDSVSVNKLVSLMKHNGLSVTYIDGFKLSIHDKSLLRIHISLSSADEDDLSQCCAPLFDTLKIQSSITKIEVSYQHDKKLRLKSVVTPILTNNPHLTVITLQNVCSRVECYEITAVAESLLAHKSVQSLFFHTKSSRQQIVFAKDRLHIQGLELCPRSLQKLLCFVDHKQLMSVNISNQHKAFHSCVFCKARKDKFLNNVFKEFPQNKKLVLLMSKLVNIDFTDQQRAFRSCLSSEKLKNEVLHAFFEVYNQNENLGYLNMSLPYLAEQLKVFNKSLACDSLEDEVVNSFLEMFDRAKSLEYFSISNCQLPANVIEKLACKLCGISKVKSVSVVSNEINLQAFNFFLTLLPNLDFQELKITGLSLFFDPNFEGLCYSCQTGNSQFLSSFVENILIFPPKQKAVKICGAEFSEIHAVPLKKILCNEESILSLSLIECHFTASFFDSVMLLVDDRATATSALKKLYLHYITFSDCSIIQLFDVFNFSCLEVLSLYINPEDQANTNNFGKLLQDMTSHLKELDLKGWYIDSSALSCLSEGLSSSRTIKVLDLSGCYNKLNDWEDVEDSENVGENLSLILTNQNMEVLNLATLPFDEKVMHLFTLGLSKNTGLRTLILDSLELPTPSTYSSYESDDSSTLSMWITFFDGLKCNASLHTLSIRDNDIQTEALAVLKELLEGSSSITTLKISQNITDCKEYLEELAACFSSKLILETN